MVNIIFVILAGQCASTPLPIYWAIRQKRLPQSIQFSTLTYPILYFQYRLGPRGLRNGKWKVRGDVVLLSVQRWIEIGTAPSIVFEITDKNRRNRLETLFSFILVVFWSFLLTLSYASTAFMVREKITWLMQDPSSTAHVHMKIMNF